MKSVNLLFRHFCVQNTIYDMNAWKFFVDDWKVRVLKKIVTVWKKLINNGKF